MRTKSIYVLIISLLVVSVSLHAKDDKKKPANELAGLNGGVVYALPRTGIRIHVEVQQDRLIHGPYNAFAQKYLGINNAPKGDEELWTITSVGMETFGEADPSAVYKASGSIATLLSLTDDGVISGINSSVKQESVKMVPCFFPPRQAMGEEVFTDLSMHSYLSEKDSTKRAGSNFKSFEEKAAEAAHDILKLRKRKALTLAAKEDKLPPDGQAYQVMVTELDKILEDYTALFSGKKIRKSYTYTFDVVPDGKSNKGLLAFRFSPSIGVLPESNVSGKPIMLEIEPDAELKQKAEAEVNGETTTKGLYYRMPVTAHVRLLNGPDVLAQARLAMAQFGVTAALPDGLLTGEYAIEFHPVTGAIKKIGTN